MKTLKANYAVVKVTENTIYIVDLNGPRSITNDAERVVVDLLAEYDRFKDIIYRDSTGQWDELQHDGTKFTGYGPGVAQGEPEEFDLTPFEPRQNLSQTSPWRSQRSQAPTYRSAVIKGQVAIPVPPVNLPKNTLDFHRKYEKLVLL